METPLQDRLPEYDDAALAEAIVGYLEQHPQAMDSLDGIMDWWLPRHQIRTDTIRLARTLESLHERGIIERVDAGSDRRYRLRRSAGRT
jgi:hypothetical protein